MKIYEVSRDEGGQVRAHVRDDARGIRRTLKHCVVHSPTGFETGYGGSGPADLALSILADHFGVPAARVERWAFSLATRKKDTAASQVWDLHQAFKRDFICASHLGAGQTYTINEQAIIAWCTVKPTTAT